jgi:acyl-CoA thioester hydrolase
VAGIPLHQSAVLPEWIDYNGHLRDAFYGLVASYAIDEVMDHLGLDAAYRADTHCTLYTLELHLHYLHEVKSSDDLGVESLVLDYDRKRLHIGCRFICSRVQGPVATADMMLMHVHQGVKPAGAAFPDAVLAKLESLKLSPAAQQEFVPGSRKIELKRR